MIPTESLLADFPILDQSIHGQRLVYLDNAATTQKPLAVLLASRHYYEVINSNIHRGTHQLARAATEAFENARMTVAAHLHAGSSDEVIFTTGTTGGIKTGERKREGARETCLRVSIHLWPFRSSPKWPPASTCPGHGTN